MVNYRNCSLWILIVLTMSKSHLLGYLSLGAGIGALFLLFNRLSERRQKPDGGFHKKCLAIEVTRKIAQEIKYQMLTVCITFASQMGKKLKNALSPEDFGKASGKLRQNITRLYEQKQTIILNKYDVQKQVYGESLQAAGDDMILASIKDSILAMMESAIEGNMPDISVPQEALDFFSAEQIVSAYRELSLTILIKFWQIIMEFMSHDASFNIKDDRQFIKIIRKLSVYDVKVNFLLQKGYRLEWGCPNQTFFKVVENVKTKDRLFYNDIIVIEKSYEQMMERIQSTPSELSEEEIEKLLCAEIVRLQSINQAQNQL